MDALLRALAYDAEDCFYYYRLLGKHHICMVSGPANERLKNILYSSIVQNIGNKLKLFKYPSVKIIKNSK